MQQSDPEGSPRDQWTQCWLQGCPVCCSPPGLTLSRHWRLQLPPSAWAAAVASTCRCRSCWSLQGHHSSMRHRRKGSSIHSAEAVAAELHQAGLAEAQGQRLPDTPPHRQTQIVWQ